MSVDTQKSRKNAANCLIPSLAIHHHSFTTTALPLTRGAKQPTQNEEGGKQERGTMDRMGYGDGICLL